MREAHVAWSPDIWRQMNKMKMSKNGLPSCKLKAVLHSSGVSKQYTWAISFSIQAAWLTHATETRSPSFPLQNFCANISCSGQVTALLSHYTRSKTIEGTNALPFFAAERENGLPDHREKNLRADNRQRQDQRDSLQHPKWFGPPQWS